MPLQLTSSTVLNSALLAVACVFGCDPAPNVRLVDASGVDEQESLECNPILQLGCGADKCTFRDGHAACTTQGTIQLGMPCSAEDDDCVGGTVCMANYCREYCYPNGDPPETLCESGICAPNPDMICSIACNPLAPSCANGEYCYLPVSGDYESAGCLLPGGRDVGTECALPNDCRAGLSCAHETFATLGYASCQVVCTVATANCPSGSCRPRHTDDGFGLCL
jgi:hypothetical protein